VNDNDVDFKASNIAPLSLSPTASLAVRLVEITCISSAYSHSPSVSQLAAAGFCPAVVHAFSGSLLSESCFSPDQKQSYTPSEVSSHILPTIFVIFGVVWLDGYMGL
jgi:hypothetical protein